MSNEKIIKELKELNKTISSIRTFIIAQTQLSKSLLTETQQIKRKMEVKDGDNWWQKFRKRYF